MGLETGTTIAALNAAWPLGTDPRSQGDDHLRLIKAVVKTDAPSKALTTTQTFAGPLRIADVYVGATPIGGNGPTTVSALTGNALNIRSGLDGLGLVYVRDASNTQVARFDEAGTAAGNPITVITAEKGDARYGPLAFAAANAIGAWGFMKVITGSANPGSTIAASGLKYTNQSLAESAAVVSGTWRAHGSGNTGQATLFQRIS